MATNRDGTLLQDIMARAPQASEGLTITLISAPDFFGRARMYDDAAVFVADVGDEPAGSASCATRELMVGGRAARVGYEFQYFTSPEHRRLGAAGRLRERIEEHLVARGVELTTAIVADSNVPSSAFFIRHGFERQRGLALTFIFTTQHTDVWPEMGVRPARFSDIEQVANLLKETWRGHEMAVDWRPETLDAYLWRVLGPGLDRLMVREERGEIIACAGIWDWSAIQKIHVNAISPEVQRVFPSFRAGESLRQWGLTTVGYRDPEDIAPLLRHIANQARAAGIDQIGTMAMPGIADFEAVFGLPVATIDVGLYVKPLVAGAALPDGPVFVDIIDL